MKKRIAILLALAPEISKDDGCLVEWWRSTAIAHARSVVKALTSQEHGQSAFSVHVVTSLAKGSTLGRELDSWGAENVNTSVNFEKTTEVCQAIQGSHGAFVITELNYHSINPLDLEVKIGRSIANACREAGVQHVIYNSRGHVNACFGLRSDVCDAKAHVSDYMDKLGLPKTTLYVPFLYEDFLDGFMKATKSEKKGVYKIAAPMGHIAMDMISAGDVGICVASVFHDPTTWIGKSVGLSGDRMTLQEFCNNITDLLYPVIVADGKVTPEEFVDIFNTTGSEDMANYFDFLTRSVQRNNLSTTMELHHNVQSFYDWVRMNKQLLTVAYS